MSDVLTRHAYARTHTPVLHDPRSGTWNVFRYDDVRTVLSDHTRFSSQRGRGSGSNNPASALADSIISLDPPRHRQLRALVERSFTRGAVEALAPRIGELVDELLAGFAGGRGDLVRDFAEPLPVIVIAEILGVPASDRADFKRWSDAVVTGDPSGSREMAAYFSRLIAGRRAEPDGADLISVLLRAELGADDEAAELARLGRTLTGQELLGFCMLLLVAGNETTTNLLSGAVMTLSGHDEARQDVLSDPALWSGAVEEVLRVRPPVTSMFRVTATPAELHGQIIPAGAWTVAWIGSANRDDRVFPDPDRFDVRRAPNRHLSFGHGIHFCLGAPLARLEAVTALRELYARFPDLRVAPGARPTPIESFFVSGVKDLEIVF